MNKTASVAAKERQCAGKLAMSEHEARDTAKRMHKRNKARYNAYECYWRRCWHVGRQRSREAAIRRETRAAG